MTIKILPKYNPKPKYIEIQNRLIDISQVGILKIYPEIIVTGEESYAHCFSVIPTKIEYKENITGKWKLKIQAKDNHYNIQETFNTEKEARSALKKLQTYLNE